MAVATDAGSLATRFQVRTRSVVERISGLRAHSCLHGSLAKRFAPACFKQCVHELVRLVAAAEATATQPTATQTSMLSNANATSMATNATRTE